MGTNRRQSAQPTPDWQFLLPLFEWPEQERYEQIRPLVVFDDVSVAGRAEEVGLSESTQCRRLNGFEAEGMESLFGSEPARRKRLPATVRRLVVDLKAEYPAFNLNLEDRTRGRPKGIRPSQLKLFALKEALGEGGWLTALALDGYAVRSRGKPEALQQVLFSYPETL